MRSAGRDVTAGLADGVALGETGVLLGQLGLDPGQGGQADTTGALVEAEALGNLGEFVGLDEAQLLGEFGVRYVFGGVLVRGLHVHQCAQGV